MFIDDSLFMQTASNIKHAMSASIEALYIVLGYPDTEIRQSSPSLDKYFESIYHFERIQLRRTSNTTSVDIDLTEHRLISTLDKLSHWHQHSRSFILLQGSMLCGNFEFWFITSPWER